MSSKKWLISSFAIVLVGALAFTGLPPSSQKGQLRGGAPAHIDFERYLPTGVNATSQRVIEISPYCSPDWVMAGQWTMTLTQPFKLDGIPFLAKKTGLDVSEPRLAREFLMVISTDPNNPETTLGEYTTPETEKTNDNFWISTNGGLNLAAGTYTISLLMGPDYLGDSLETVYNGTVSLDKIDTSPYKAAWGKFTEKNLKVTKKSEAMSFGNVAFSLKIDQKVNDHSQTECRTGEWVALSDEEYYGPEPEKEIMEFTEFENLGDFEEFEETENFATEDWSDGWENMTWSDAEEITPGNTAPNDTLTNDAVRNNAAEAEVKSVSDTTTPTDTKLTPTVKTKEELKAKADMDAKSKAN